MTPGIRLSRAEKRQLNALRKTAKDSKTYRAVLGVLLRAQGKTAEEVAFALGVTRKQVFVWCARYRKSGVSGLELKTPPGRPSVEGVKAKKRIPALLKKQPSEFGYLKRRWVLRDIAKQLNAEGIPLCYQSVHLLLQDLGFAMRRPVLRAPGSIRRNYLKRKEIANYKRVAAALLKKEGNAIDNATIYSVVA